MSSNHLNYKKSPGADDNKNLAKKSSDKGIRNGAKSSSMKRAKRRRSFWKKYGVLLMLLVIGIGYVVFRGISIENGFSFRNGLSFRNGYFFNQGSWNLPFLTTPSIESGGSIVQTDPDQIPDYAGSDYIMLNYGVPNFTETELQTIRGEHFSRLDRLGRCGTAFAMLDRSMMPTEKRGEIGHIKPTGWVQNKYEGIINSYPPYLYNRCHLIAYALSGQNDNEQNLITGTRYFNATAMLPFEEQVMRYLNNSDNHVLYRVTPYFKGRELLARGVEMEAYSVEDHGTGVCFHVFVYNQQPGIEIDYRTGDNKIR